MTGALRFPATLFGMIDASIARRALTPCTRDDVVRRTGTTRHIAGEVERNAATVQP